jgi:hypothetical protein
MLAVGLVLAANLPYFFADAVGRPKSEFPERRIRFDDSPTSATRSIAE